MQSVVANIAIGLVTSLLGGGFVWLWERAKRARAVNRRADFFGVRPEETCLVVVGRKHDAPGSPHYRDVRAVVELTLLAGELGCRVSVEPGTFRGSNGDRTEFCVGGPLGEVNARASGHLAAHLPGVVFHPYDGRRRNSVAIEVGGEKYQYEPDAREYAVVAKFTPVESSRPVFLVCGQSSMANLAAIHFLRREFAAVARGLRSTERFCLLIRVSDSATYEHHRAELAKDVSVAAFAR
ncbi:hypothetical protein [Streptomyces sp. NPDC127098]|uniref:hypothetical protein n=1 Tax=Streptomyces sp. NPDC127098 TaxID=3347137 RepID=UPI0036650DE5